MKLHIISMDNEFNLNNLIVKLKALFGRNESNYFSDAYMPIIKKIPKIHSDISRLKQSDQIKYNELVKFILLHDKEKVLNVLEKNITLNTPDKKNWTPLFYAASKCYDDLIAILIDHGSDVNYMTPDCKTVLMLAAEQGNIKTVKFLLSKGARINLHNSGNITALDYAISKGFTDILKLLIERGADNKSLSQSLITAAGYHDLSSAELLISHGAKIDEASQNSGFNALMTAVLDDNSKMVNLLISNGANVNVYNDFSKEYPGYTPLMFAVENQSNEIIDLLIKSGAKINVQDYDGVSPLMMAIVGGNPSIINKLIQEGADESLTDSDGWNAMMYAARFDRFEIVRNSKKNLSLINISDVRGFTPLMIAVWNGYVNTAKLLIDLGANENTKIDKGKYRGFTAKNFAELSGNKDIITLFNH